MATPVTMVNRAATNAAIPPNTFPASPWVAVATKEFPANDRVCRRFSGIWLKGNFRRHVGGFPRDFSSPENAHSKTLLDTPFSRNGPLPDSQAPPFFQKKGVKESLGHPFDEKKGTPRLSETPPFRENGHSQTPRHPPFSRKRGVKESPGHPFDEKKGTPGLSGTPLFREKGYS